MPETGLAQGSTIEGLNSDLNKIRPGQGDKTKFAMKDTLKRYYPGLNDQQLDHMLGGMQKQFSSVKQSKKEFGQTDEGRFQSKYGGLSEPTQNWIREQESQKKAEEEYAKWVHSQQIAKARSNPFINLAPSAGEMSGRGRKVGVQYRRPHDPRNEY